MSSKRKQGFTLVEIMIVVAIIAILAAVAIPAFIAYRERAGEGTCLSNIMSIQGAKEALATTIHPQNWNPTDIPDEADIGALMRGGWPVCPNGGNYDDRGAYNEWPACSVCDHDEEHFPDLE